MKEFKCRTIVPGCPTVFEGESESEILNQIGDHARDAHGMDEVPSEVVDQIRANITERAEGR
jgi:predicted small metal-binding protein